MLKNTESKINDESYSLQWEYNYGSPPISHNSCHVTHKRVRVIKKRQHHIKLIFKISKIIYHIIFLLCVVLIIFMFFELLNFLLRNSLSLVNFICDI
jgi:hypothetical protein